MAVGWNPCSMVQKASVCLRKFVKVSLCQDLHCKPAKTKDGSQRKLKGDNLIVVEAIFLVANFWEAMKSVASRMFKSRSLRSLRLCQESPFFFDSSLSFWIFSNPGDFVCDPLWLVVSFVFQDQVKAPSRRKGRTARTARTARLCSFFERDTTFWISKLVSLLSTSFARKLQRILGHQAEAASSMFHNVSRNFSQKFQLFTFLNSAEKRRRGWDGRSFQGKEWEIWNLELNLSDRLYCQDTMPLFHDTLWRVTAIDIEYTLAKVMQRVHALGTNLRWNSLTCLVCSRVPMNSRFYGTCLWTSQAGSNAQRPAEKKSWEN